MNNGWTPGLPQAPGKYWLYRPEESERHRIALIDTALDGNGRLMHCSQLEFIYPGREKARHQPAIIPEPPETGETDA
jgi:hypothetical protein